MYMCVCVCVCVCVCTWCRNLYWSLVCTQCVCVYVCTCVCVCVPGVGTYTGPWSAHSVCVCTCVRVCVCVCTWCRNLYWSLVCTQPALSCLAVDTILSISSLPSPAAKPLNPISTAIRTPDLPIPAEQCTTAGPLLSHRRTSLKTYSVIILNNMVN